MQQEKLEEAISLAMSIEGMTTEPALRLMGAFIDRMQALTPAGSLVEFGTYKGRVAALLGKTARPGEILHLCDIHSHLEEARLREAGIRYEFHKTESERWCRKIKGQYGLSHHDASHYFDNVLTEITALAPHMDPLGVMVLDDFTDPFNQVRAAYYYARYVKALPFELLMIGFGKAVLVHSAHFATWEAFVLDELQPMLARGKLPTTLFRTDANRQSRAFSIAKKLTPDAPDHYGINVWGEKYYGPTW